MECMACWFHLNTSAASANTSPSTKTNDAAPSRSSALSSMFWASVLGLNRGEPILLLPPLRIDGSWHKHLPKIVTTGACAEHEEKARLIAKLDYARDHILADRAEQRARPGARPRAPRTPTASQLVLKRPKLKQASGSVPALRSLGCTRSALVMLGDVAGLVGGSPIGVGARPDLPSTSFRSKACFYFDQDQCRLKGGELQCRCLSEATNGKGRAKSPRRRAAFFPSGEPTEVLHATGRWQKSQLRIWRRLFARRWAPATARQ